MSEPQNPYAQFDDRLLAADAPENVRATFLKKVYGLLLAGVLVFAGVLALASMRGGPLEGVVRSVASIPGGWITHMVLMMLGFWAVRAAARKPGLNVAVYFGFCIGLALILAPMVYVIAGAGNGGTVIMQASILTAIVFTGLTGYVLIRGADFGFLGGFLTILFFAIIGLGLLSMFGVVQMGAWLSVLGVVLYAGFILYDTSNILHRYPVEEPTSAAVELFADVALLFQNVLHLVWSFSSD